MQLLCNRFEIFQNLQLNIGDNCNNIYDCLDLYTKEEQLDKEMKFGVFISKK